MNLLVTAIFDLYPDEKESRLGIDFRVGCLNRLIDCGAYLLVFADRSIAARLHRNESTRIFELELAVVETFNRIVSRNPRLPAGGNEAKDTLKYLALMASKFEIVNKAREIAPGFSHYSWIDAGIPKLFDDENELVRKVTALRDIRSDKIVSALGTYPMLPVGQVAIDVPYWRFLGGLFIFPSSRLSEFIRHFDQCVAALLGSGMMTWEVNIVSFIESQRSYLFSGYVADHDRTILNVPEEYIG